MAEFHFAYYRPLTFNVSCHFDAIFASIIFIDRAMANYLSLKRIVNRINHLKYSVLKFVLFFMHLPFMIDSCIYVRL
jgi:hypothetical protein